MLSRLSADVLHSHFGNVAYGNLGIARATAMKHVVGFYGYDATAAPHRDPRWYSRYRELFARVDAVLAEGPAMGQRLRTLGCADPKLQILHLGVNLERLPWRARTWDGRTPLRILMAASFRPKKGIPYGLAAISRLARDLPVSVSIVGDATGDEQTLAEKRAIHTAIERHALGDSVRLLGYQPWPSLLREAYAHHVFVAPSNTADDGDSEGGLPVALIEMAATGMPVVSTRHADIPELVEHQKTGLLADERDVDGLVAQLRWLAGHRDRWTSLAAAARAHIESEFNAATQGLRLAALYQRLTG
jgi:colanic acid/amylovoran biosynthesis glycosyltransferase